MSMTSKNKLIKQGIKYTDSVFDEIARRLSNGVKVSDTLEDFLSRYDLYTTNDDGNKEGKNKPILLSEYKDKMLQLILAETNNHRFSRPSQKEMVRVVIENSVGDLIVDVSEDVQASVREIVKDGYNNELSQDEIAEQITNKVSSIKNRRARAIARTEIARTATISDYIISKERGATHFYVECRNTACPVCKQAWHEKWTLENDDNFNPRDKSAGGKGWIGDRVFSMNDVGDLPPKHPNCRCVAYFITEKDIDKDMVIVQESTPTTTVTETVEETKPTEEQLKQNLTPEEYIRYTRTIDRDIVNYEKSFKETFKDDEKLVELFKTKYEDALKEKEALIKKALTGGEKKESFSISPIENYSLETLKKDIPINESTFDNLMSWSKKRASKNKIEYGYQFDTSTGEIIGEEVRGKKGSVSFTQQGTNIGSIHTHPPVEGDVGGGSFPSKQDLKIYRSQRGADHLIGSPTEIWYVHAEENLNSGVLGQREIDAIYNKVYNEVTEKGQKLVKEGKLKTDDKSLRKFLDKEIGDGLLREFNTKEWQDKGFYIRRVYR